jgi:hypothetical protein
MLKLIAAWQGNAAVAARAAGYRKPQVEDCTLMKKTCHQKRDQEEAKKPIGILTKNRFTVRSGFHNPIRLINA